MALKPDRVESPYGHDITFYSDEVMERGGIAVVATVGSGGYPGDSKNVCTYAASPTNKRPVGLVLHDVVDVDQTRYHLNWYKSEVAVGSKVGLARQGLFTTNMLVPGTAPTGGEAAYLGASGLLTTTSGTAQVGQFKTSKDEDGYVAVYIDLL